MLSFGPLSTVAREKLKSQHTSDNREVNDIKLGSFSDCVVFTIRIDATIRLARVGVNMIICSY